MTKAQIRSLKFYIQYKDRPMTVGSLFLLNRRTYLYFLSLLLIAAVILYWRFGQAGVWPIMIVARTSHALVHVEYTMTMGASMMWGDHRIESGGSVYDASKRNWTVWIAFWPLHRTESFVRCIVWPMPRNSAFDKFNSTALTSR